MPSTSWARATPYLRRWSRELPSKSTFVSSHLKGKPLPRKASELNDDLHKGKAYSQPEWRQTQVWLDLRNEAAHGKPEFQKRTDADIRPMVAGIRAFIVKYPA